LPKTNVGKILRRQLRDELRAAAAAQGATPAPDPSTPAKT
jgi:acyl-coenzyme A synthetase/AMP-(fatty) acid ligase